MVFYHSRKWEKKIKILMIFAYLSWFFLSGRKPAGGGKKQYRLSILIIKNHHLQYWSCKFILSWHFSLFKVREKQPNLMKNGPPPWRNFLDGRVPAGGGTKVYKLSILRNVVHLVHYWGHLYILDHFFSLLKIKKNAKNAKNGPPLNSVIQRNIWNGWKKTKRDVTNPSLPVFAAHKAVIQPHNVYQWIWGFFCFEIYSVLSFV